MTPPAQDLLVARKLGAIELGLHAHRDYLAHAGTPRTLAELASHSLIGYDRETAFVRSVQVRFPSLRREAFAFRSDSDVAQLSAIRGAFGVGMCQVPLARRTPELVRLMPRAVAFHLEVWLAMHGDLRASPRCKVVFDALVDGLLAYMERPAKRR
jgi:hypothetical protein